MHASVASFNAQCGPDYPRGRLSNGGRAIHVLERLFMYLLTIGSSCVTYFDPFLPPGAGQCRTGRKRIRIVHNRLLGGIYPWQLIQGEPQPEGRTIHDHVFAPAPGDAS